MALYIRIGFLNVTTSFLKTLTQMSIKITFFFQPERIVDFREKPINNLFSTYLKEKLLLNPKVIKKHLAIFPFYGKTIPMFFKTIILKVFINKIYSKNKNIGFINKNKVFFLLFKGVLLFFNTILLFKTF
jgi:hypothetical protein